MSKEEAIEDAFFGAIKKAKEQDPLAGVKMGAKEITSRFTSAFDKNKGVHVESYFTALGSLAGFACQMAIREAIIKSGKGTEQEVFTIITDKEGNKYFIGDNLNKPLAENRLSVWGIVAAGIQDTGAELPDIHDIFSHSIKTIGSEEFGKPRVPEKHQATMDIPINYVKDLWPVTLPILIKFCDSPLEWPAVLALSLQSMVIQARDVIEPNIAGTIIMETAIAMSKIDPKSVNVE